MTQEARLGWPGLRERIVELGQKTVNALREPGVRSATHDGAMFDRVAGIIEQRSSSLLQSLTTGDR